MIHEGITRQFRKRVKLIVNMLVLLVSYVEQEMAGSVVRIFKSHVISYSF